MKLECAAVRRCDLGDDRESEPDAVVGACAVGNEAPERLGELADLVVGRSGPPFSTVMRALAPSALTVTLRNPPAAVVADGVVDEVGRQTAKQRLVADHLDLVERAAHGDASVGGSLGLGRERAVLRLSSARRA